MVLMSSLYLQYLQEDRQKHQDRWYTGLGYPVTFHLIRFGQLSWSCKHVQRLTHKRCKCSSFRECFHVIIKNTLEQDIFWYFNILALLELSRLFQRKKMNFFFFLKEIPLNHVLLLYRTMWCIYVKTQPFTCNVSSSHLSLLSFLSS